MKVAVTGGAGFLGSHVARRLIDGGDDVVIVDNFSTGTKTNLDGVTSHLSFLEGDLRNYAFARGSMQNVEAVYHFAADIGNVSYLHGSQASEQRALQRNVAIDSNVFRAVVENNVRTVIYASSVSVYPKLEQMGQPVRFKETDTQRLIDPEGGYGWAKFIGEKQLELLSEKRVGIARIFHAYGPRLYLKEDRSQVVGSLIRKAINFPLEEFVVWGDGSQRRPFLYVDDLIDGLVKLAAFVDDKESLTVNFGATNEVRIKDLAEEIIRISGKRIGVTYNLEKPTGVLSRLPDLERARSLLGWEPKTRLADGLAETFRWALRELLH